MCIRDRDIFQNPVTCRAARLTGCKNISRIERLGERRIRAVDWDGLELATDRPVGDVYKRQVYYRIPGFKGSIGLISAIHGKFCSDCNRVRLTSQGDVYKRQAFMQHTRPCGMFL